MHKNKDVKSYLKEGDIMAVGLLESFGLFEEYGSKALTVDEVFFMADAKKRKGCKLESSKLTKDEVQKVITLGNKIKKWRSDK